MSTPMVPDPIADGETRAAAAEARSERRIGPYRVVREIGHGGMGIVYLAARADDQYRKRVAIKVIPTGTDSAEAVRHFRRERQILASLDHPHIARLLDGGTTDDGRPYLVMEFIEGDIITRYCDRHHRSLIDRLELFQKVCAAVAHAHRNLIVHRDLKPANILVAADGAPKLLDFGIAAFLNPELSGESDGSTRLALTADYASPEQIQNRIVTTSSDVYSLGVVLYELLTGRSPYHVQTRSTAEIVRAVCELEPMRPSTAVLRATSKERASSTAPEPGGEASTTAAAVPDARLGRRLRGDLDNIILKALRKDPEQRYLSADALSDDIRRYLEGRPVLARRPTIMYRTQRFLQRNWLPVSAAAVASVLVVSSAIALAVQARRLERERDKSERIAAFLSDLFTVSDPSQSRGNTVTAREILDDGVKKIETALIDDPVTRGDLVATMADVYESLGLYGEAERLTRQSLELRRQALGDEHEATQESVEALAFLLNQTGRATEAAALAEPALAIQRRTLGDDHQITLATKGALGLAYRSLGRLQDSERLLLEVIEAKTRLLGRDHEDTLKTLNNLAIVYESQGRMDEALKLDREILDLRRRRLGDTHPLTIGSMNNLAVAHGAAGRHEDARSILQQALRLGEQTWGVDHPGYATIVHSLGEIELASGNTAAADDHLRSALRIYRLQPAHRHVPLVLYQLAQVSARQARIDDALDLLEQAAAAGYFQNSGADLRGDPHLASIADDPRLQAFETRVNGNPSRQR